MNSPLLDIDSDRSTSWIRRNIRTLGFASQLGANPIDGSYIRVHG